MNIITARHGEIEIELDKIVEVKHGLIGFPHFTRYVVLPFMEGTEFQLLQSVDEPSLGFIILDPFLFMPDYNFEINDAMQEELGITSPEQIQLAVIITIPEGNHAGMTANLQGPIVINKEQNSAAQLVLQGDEYHTKHQVFEEEKEEEKE